MRETLIMLLKQAHDAQRFINQKGRTEIKSVLRNFIHDISSMISQYIQHVQYRVSNTSLINGLYIYKYSDRRLFPIDQV